MTTDAIRRLMRRNLDVTTLAAAARNERVALLALSFLVRRGLLGADR